MPEYMLFVQRFDRSYTFHHKSMGAQIHIPGKHCPSMLRDDPCTYEQSTKKRTCHSTFTLQLFTGRHCSRNNSADWTPKLQFKDHLCLGNRKVLCKTSEQPRWQTQITSELVMEKYLYCTALDTEVVSSAMSFAQQFSDIFNK